MVNNKLLSLLALVIVISSCASLATASTVTLTNNGHPSYAPMQGSMPFPFATATPTPTATPKPTPTPTPKPEPTVYPTVTLNCISSAAASNLKVEITGTLTYNKTGIPSTPVYVGFSADCGNKWENFSLVQTHADGSFEAVWTPNATGSYLLCARWSGNDSLHWMNATVNLATISDISGNEFSAVSNSTLSNLGYNSTKRELTFNANGNSSTTGYAQVCIPKTLVSDLHAITLEINGKSAAFGGESHGDVWVISCVYAQSSQAFTVKLPLVQVLRPAETNWAAIIVVIVVLLVLAAVIVVVRRKRRTAATVASILKQNRPSY